MTKTRPDYVAARIAQSQRLARPGTCPKCRAAVLFGDDHDQVSYWTTVDAEPIPVSREREVVAAGLSTYDLDNGQLCYREPWHYETSRYPIHVWHVCRG